MFRLRVVAAFGRKLVWLFVARKRDYANVMISTEIAIAPDTNLWHLYANYCKHIASLMSLLLLLLLLNV